MAKKQIEREVRISTTLKDGMTAGLQKLASALGITDKEQRNIAKSGTVMGRSLRASTALVKSFSRTVLGGARSLVSFKSLVLGAGGLNVLPVLVKDSKEIDSLTASQKSSMLRLFAQYRSEFRQSLGLY